MGKKPLSLECSEEDHCDGFIEDPSADKALRWYLLINRLPAVDKYLALEMGVDPKLFALYNGRPVRIVMASRLGDVGITVDLNSDHGYDKRVLIKELTDFTDKHPPCTKCSHIEVHDEGGGCVARVQSGGGDCDACGCSESYVGEKKS